MFRLGLTSVTFRELPPEEIATICRLAGLDGIEWGGDVHLPPGRPAEARRLRALTEDKGLQVLSYGSYYRVGASGQPDRDFGPVLETARLLGAPLIRVWPGDRGSALADWDAYAAAAAETAAICRMAGEYGIRVAYEYHPGTLTDCIASARRLLEMCGACGAASLWQPRPVPWQENLAELKGLGDYLANIHVFHWTRRDGRTLRRPLAEGEADWLRYLRAAGHIPGRHDLILEFVKDDRPECLLEDAQTLRRWVRRLEENVPPMR